MGRKKLVSDEQLLESAREVFVERGLAGSTREIARRAGVSEAILFQRYATKADLFFTAMVPPAFDLRACVPEPLCGQRGEHVLRALFVGMIEYFRAAAPVLVQLLAHQDFEFERFAQAHPENGLVTLRVELVRVLSELRNARQLGGDPRWVALTLFMSACSLVLFERIGAHGGRFPDEMIDATVAEWWRGFSVSGLGVSPHSIA